MMLSDHKPVSFSLDCKTCMNSTADTNTHGCTATWIPNWQHCNENILTNYRYWLDRLLHDIDVPWYLLSDSCTTCDAAVVDKFHKDVFSCISTTVHGTIHVRKCSYSEFNIPGWNTYVKEKHDIAREAYLDWTRHGKPKMGILFDNMKRTRGAFKLALRYCKRHAEEMRADACAESIMDKDCRKFRNCVYKISNSKATNHVSCIGSISGVKNITHM